LLRRERTLTHLTDLGRLMRPYLEQILRQAEEAKQQAKGFLKLDKAELHLGMLSSIGPLNFTSFLGGFHHRHPGIRLVITEGSPQRLAELLQQGELEVAAFAGLKFAAKSRQSRPDNRLAA
jgi:DNA-binding transcriptional LysR family regulator